MKKVAFKITYFLIGSAGLGIAGFFYYRSLFEALNLNEAIIPFGYAVGTLLVSLILLFMVQLQRDNGHAIARLGHFTSQDGPIEEYDSTTWINHYSTTRIEFPRPKRGKTNIQVRCHNCSELDIEIWSVFRAFRNKLFVIITFSLYCFFWVIVSHSREGNYCRDGALSIIMGILCIPAFIFAFPFPFLLMAFILDPWHGTHSGICKTRLFFGGDEIDNNHKIFEEKTK